MSGPDARWTVEVDAGRCIGSGICAGTAPDRFVLLGSVAEPLDPTVPPDDAVITAAESCPVEAITVRDAADHRLIAPEQ